MKPTPSNHTLKIEDLLNRLRYYQTEHGSFEIYIPEVGKKLKSLGYNGPWNFYNDERNLGVYTEFIAKD